jgi:GNAT superfamily N-acetyltransferase
MTAISSPISATEEHLRPFDVRHDLKDVAGLVERSFADTLDSDGRRYIQQMHAAARNPTYLHWAAAAADRIPLPLTGYVWEEHGRIVGNLSLIPFRIKHRRCYLIANVAVEPEYRRRGIARSLTIHAIDHVQRKGAFEVWLHVRAENHAAINLYQSLNFDEHLRRSTWHSTDDLQGTPNLEIIEPPEDVSIARPVPRHWPQQQAWLKDLYPPEITWHLPFHPKLFKTGLLAALHRFLTGTTIRHWAAVRGDDLLGVLTSQPLMNHSDYLWLACSPENEDIAIPALLPHARRQLPRRIQMTLDYPANRGFQALHNAGFSLHQTLIWMKLQLTG